MLKFIIYSPTSSFGQHLIPINFNGFRKQASVIKEFWSPEILSFIKKGEFDTSSDSLVVLTNVLGACEYYGPNANGDAFSKEALSHDGLDYGYKTFEKFGHVYLHHINHDPQKSVGKILFAHYNPRMNRVETIDLVNKHKAEKFAEQIEQGEYPSVSMGCKVSHDVCSICNNKATKIAYYCDHLKTSMNRVLPGGKQVCAYNPEPIFFDRSYVIVGADRTAGHLAKVASNSIFTMPSAMVGSLIYGEHGEKIADPKKADIVKEIPVDNIKVIKSKELSEIEKKALGLFLKHALPCLENFEKTFDKLLIKKLAEFPLDNVISTATALGIVLKPQEFSSLMLTKSGQHKMANLICDISTEEFWKMSVDITKNYKINKEYKVDLKLCDDKAASYLDSVIKNRSIFEPFFSERLGECRNSKLIKKSGVVSSVIDPSFLSDLAGLILAYLAYRSAIPNTSLIAIEEILKANPKLLLPLIGGGALIHRAFSNDVYPGEPKYSFSKKALFEKTSYLGTVVLPIGAAYLASAYLANRRRYGEQLSGIEEFIADNPLLAGGGTALGLAQFGRFKDFLGKMYEKAVQSNVPKTAEAIALQEVPIEFLQTFERRT